MIVGEQDPSLERSQVLDAEPDLEVVAEAGDGAEAVKRGLVGDVDLAIVDISMPRMTGLQAVRELQRRRPELRTLILSMHENERYLYEALKAGASGYVLKTVADRDLVEACRAAMRGEAFLYPGAMTTLISDYLRQARDEQTIREEPLTPREQEVVKLIAESYSTKQIVMRWSSARRPSTGIARTSSRSSGCTPGLP